MLPPATADELDRLGHDAVAALRIEMGAADDVTVFEHAVTQRRVVVTENFADFAALLTDHQNRGEPSTPVVSFGATICRVGAPWPVVSLGNWITGLGRTRDRLSASAGRDDADLTDYWQAVPSPPRSTAIKFRPAERSFSSCEPWISIRQCYVATSSQLVAVTPRGSHSKLTLGSEFS